MAACGMDGGIKVYENNGDSGDTNDSSAPVDDDCPDSSGVTIPLDIYIQDNPDDGVDHYYFSVDTVRQVIDSINTLNGLGLFFIDADIKAAVGSVDEIAEGGPNMKLVIFEDKGVSSEEAEANEAAATTRFGAAFDGGLVMAWSQLEYAHPCGVGPTEGLIVSGILAELDEYKSISSYDHLETLLETGCEFLNLVDDALINAEEYYDF